MTDPEAVGARAGIKAGLVYGPLLAMIVSGGTVWAKFDELIEMVAADKIEAAVSGARLAEREEERKAFEVVVENLNNNAAAANRRANMLRTIIRANAGCLEAVPRDLREELDL